MGEQKVLGPAAAPSKKHLGLAFSLVEAAAVLGVTLGCVAGFGRSSADEYASNMDQAMSYTLNRDYTFNNPSQSQIDSLSAMDGVSLVSKAYSVKGTLGEDEVNISYSESQEASDFTQARLVSSAEATTGYPLFADYRHAASKGWSLGTCLEISGIAFEISGLYRGVGNSSFYCPNLVSALKEKYNQDLAFTAAQVVLESASDDFAAFAASYQPLGVKRSRADFDTEEAYQEYLTSFDARDYSDYVVASKKDATKAAEFTAAADQAKRSSWYKALVVLGAILAICLLMFVSLRKGIKKEIVNNGTRARKAAKNAIWLSCLTGVISATIAFGVSLPILLYASAYYVGLGTSSLIALPYALYALVGAMGTLAGDLAFISERK